MHQTIDIHFGVINRSLTFDAPEGRPTSIVSSTLYETTTGDDGTAEVAHSGSAAIEATPSTTFNAASGAAQSYPDRCNLTATTGAAVGRSYLATNALGQSERAEVVGISSGAYVIVRDPLANDYAASDTFQSTRISHPLGSSWVSDIANLSDDIDPNPRYRWRLVYVVASVTYVHDLYADLLRYPARHDVTASDVELYAPGWKQRLPEDHRVDEGRALIDRAHRTVKFDLYNLSTPDQSIRNRELVNELVMMKAVAMVDATEMNAKIYEDRLTQFIAWGKAAVSTDSSGASAKADVRPVFRR